MASGFGFHPIAEIAAVRALAEAVQGRLSHIHGGRDDIVKRVKISAELGRERELDHIRRLRRMAMDPRGEMGFADVPSFEVSSIADAQSHLLVGLAAAGMRHVVRVALTEADYPFQVVKIIVPGAEMYEHEIKRVGPRLLAHVQQKMESQHV